MKSSLTPGWPCGQPFPSLGSRDSPVQNAYDSTDLYLGPKAPEGKEKNWLATVPGKSYFAILRLYGPTDPAGRPHSRQDNGGAGEHDYFFSTLLVPMLRSLASRPAESICVGCLAR